MVPSPRRLVLGLALLSGCRGTPPEAPEPDAAWSEPGFDPGEPVPSQASASGDPTRPAPPRPRPPGAIFRDEIERATGPGPAYLLRQLGPEPYRHEGHFVGWTITRLFPDDPSLCALDCDLAVGDVILGVNGRPMRTPQELSDAFDALPGWTSLQVHSLRDGQRRRATYDIVDDPG